MDIGVLWCPNTFFSKMFLSIFFFFPVCLVLFKYFVLLKGWNVTIGGWARFAMGQGCTLEGTTLYSRSRMLTWFLYTGRNWSFGSHLYFLYSATINSSFILWVHRQHIISQFYYSSYVSNQYHNLKLEQPCSNLYWLSMRLN